MGDNILYDPSERPISYSESSRQVLIRRLWGWIGIPGLTLLVLGLQTWVIRRQAEIMDKQTSLMQRAADLAEEQHQLASRPNVTTSFSLTAGGKHELSIKNLGPYDIRDVRFRVLYFKKFVGLGWHDSISSEALLTPVLRPGGETSVDVDKHFLPYGMKDRAGRDYPSVPNAEFYVVSFVFQRQVDDKRYLYLKPFTILFGPQELKPELTASAGPVAFNCSLDTFAIELASEFYRRNPLPYPAELYNYHYLFGDPQNTCLKTGEKSLRW